MSKLQLKIMIFIWSALLIVEVGFFIHLFKEKEWTYEIWICAILFVASVMNIGRILTELKRK